MLRDLIEASAIVYDMTSRDWESAIHYAAHPLVLAKKIDAAYPDAIIKSAKDFGPYFVVAPGIAIPHARPEEGALENAIGISVLANSVNFLESPNNPVRYLFTLSMTSSRGHLEALAQLIELFEQEGFLDCLSRVQAPSDVINILTYIEKWSESQD